MKPSSPLYRQYLAATRQREMHKIALIKKSLKTSHIPKHLVRFRDYTIENTGASMDRSGPPKFHFHKTKPWSDVPNFQHLRHARKKARIVREKENVFYQMPQQSPVRMIESDKFQSPGKTVYGFGHTVITIETPGGTRDRLRPLENLENVHAKRQISFEAADALPFPQRVSAVTFSFNNLKRPAGKNEPIDNKKAQGGYTANELFTEQCDALREQLIEAGLFDADTINATIDNTPRFEHTHLIAAHFGRVKNAEGQIVDPRNPESTFVAPAALNTEMMLFEKFADFLIYKNHTQHGYPAHEKTVEYTCKVMFPNEDSTVAIGVQLQIKDKHTGIVFTQTWDNPYAVTEKPSMALYTTLIQGLKAGLERKLQGPRI